MQAQPLTEEHRALPPPDFSVSMKFSIQLKDSRKEPCSARYLHAVSVEYHTHAVGDEPGSVVKADLQVLGLGGSRVVVRSPANPTLAWKLSRESQDTEREMFRIMGNWTPTRIRALGVHRVKEIGKGAATFYVSVLEQELCAPCPQFSPSVAFELLLTVAHTAKLVQVRDLGRKNVGSRRRDSGQMGEPPKDAILLVDANYWQQYKTGSRPHWPNRQRAQGLWSSLQTFTPDLVPKVQVSMQTWNPLPLPCSVSWMPRWQRLRSLRRVTTLSPLRCLAFPRMDNCASMSYGMPPSTPWR